MIFARERPAKITRVRLVLGSLVALLATTTPSGGFVVPAAALTRGPASGSILASSIAHGGAAAASGSGGIVERERRQPGLAKNARLEVSCFCSQQYTMRAILYSKSMV